MYSYKNWLKIFTLVTIIFLAIIAGVNYVIDPMFCFNHPGKNNSIFLVIDEKEQKTNNLYFNRNYYKKLKLDGLILGTSRVAFVNQYDFGGLKLFNYACPSMNAYKDYADYVDFAKKTVNNGLDFKYIVIGLDFFESGRNPKLMREKDPKYFNRIKNKLFILTQIFSADNFRYSLINFYYNFNKIIPNELGYYQRSNIKLTKIDPKEVQEKNIKQKIAAYKDHYCKFYKYDPAYKKELIDLKARNKNSKVIVFTTPEAYPLYEIIKENVFPQYDIWLKDIADIFGNFYHFDYPNTITINYADNYKEPSHFYPKVGTLIAHKLVGINDKNIPADFGVLLDKSNVENYIKNQKVN